MTPDLQDIASRVERRAGRRDSLRDHLAAVEGEFSKLEADGESIREATEVIQVVAKATQEELEVHISELVSLALEAVFPEPYRLVLKFTLRRNRSEADLLLEDAEGNQVNPMDSAGGGVIDVAALALRIALWSLKRPRPRNVIILDEPLRFLSADLQDRASAMLGEISGKLGIQFILVSHEENLLQSADRMFQFHKVGGRTKEDKS